jgi:mRNA interferase MazF
MVIQQGEIWWADLDDPLGSGPGFRRPVLVVQGNAFNQGRIATVLCVPLTSTVRLANAPGNVMLTARQTGLDRDSVAVSSQLIALDRSLLSEHAGEVPTRLLERVLRGIDLVLGR